jgi:hypothetical protein
MTLTRSRSRAALAAAVVAVALVAAGCVTGPLPLQRPDPTLAARGYEQREYFLGGLATAYGMSGTWGSDGHWTAVPTTKASFRTRLIVRRPVDPAKFNGTVLVEWLNVSSGLDLDVTYGAAVDELLRDGYAYVGVSAQKRGVDQLKSGDPNRYGTLVHPGDDYSYDIFSQAGIAIRNRVGVDMLGGLHAQHVIATGESQSAARFVTYINAIQPLVHAYEGFLVYSRGAGAAPLFGNVTMPTPSLFRTDQHDPVIDVQTEGDLVVLRSHLAHQPDDHRLRLWEVAGGSHADEHTISRQVPPNPTSDGSPCTFRVNSASTFAVVSAAVEALAKWVDGGPPPPHSPRLTLGNDPSAADPVVRDADGNAEGGIRLPDLAAPISTITGIPNPAPPDANPIFQAFCRLFGQTHPFSAARLAQLYPTHDAYVTRFDDATDDVVHRGFVLPEEGAELKFIAQTSNVGGS